MFQKNTTQGRDNVTPPRQQTVIKKVEKSNLPFGESIARSLNARRSDLGKSQKKKMTDKASEYEQKLLENCQKPDINEPTSSA